MYHFDAKGTDLKPSGFDLQFVLENTTNRDYTVPQTLKLFKRQTLSNALDEFDGTLDHSFVIPSRDRAELRVSVQRSCTIIDLATQRETTRDINVCFEDALGDVSGFVGFDYDTNTRLNLPKPVLSVPDKGKTPPAQAEAESPRNLPPDKGDVFDRVVSCQQAESFLARCKKKQIALPKESIADLGAFQKPLPEMPEPPRGYVLDPSPSDCDIALQWQNFCALSK